MMHLDLALLVQVAPQIGRDSVQVMKLMMKHYLRRSRSLTSWTALSCQRISPQAHLLRAGPVQQIHLLVPTITIDTTRTSLHHRPPQLVLCLEHLHLEHLNKDSLQRTRLLRHCAPHLSHCKSMKYRKKRHRVLSWAKCCGVRRTLPSKYAMFRNKYSSRVLVRSAMACRAFKYLLL